MESRSFYDYNVRFGVSFAFVGSVHCYTKMTFMTCPVCGTGGTSLLFLRSHRCCWNQPNYVERYLPNFSLNLAAHSVQYIWALHIVPFVTINRVTLHWIILWSTKFNGNCMFLHLLCMLRLFSIYYWLNFSYMVHICA